MSLPIEITQLAAESIRQLAEQAGHYSAASRLRLLADIADKVSLIEQQPEMYPVVPAHAPVRRCVVIRTISLFYRIEPHVILVLDVIDSRHDPSALGL